MLFAKCPTVKRFEVGHARCQGLQTSKVFWKPTFEGFVLRPFEELTSKRLNLCSRGMVTVWAFCKMPNCQTLWGWPCTVAGAANLQGFWEPTYTSFVPALLSEADEPKQVRRSLFWPVPNSYNTHRLKHCPSRNHSHWLALQLLPNVFKSIRLQLEVLHPGR